ncbi:NHLM bacteriocin system secretion protein [Xenococcus sp. PCC 7305]|uniref:NHLP bacteriocin system secretion protein n=1 Tax=Xenococcus sp. PCC 7305 TaxID=102125 RepID=UPI0002AC38A2|nr:NHLP bacteriocin system secretion protein [Xenococcus sp. PCC 7305]ELS04355.1 NHLM bacteriocin system secretion protein [Xenococcus sp. PCC 7305]
MSKEKRSLFRQQALDRLSSPERLDRLMQVVGPKDWLPLGGLLIFGILAILWSVFGNIPITVTGKGILINPRRVVQLQSPISGELQSLNISDGKCVDKNEILAIIDPSDTKQKLQQQQAKLTQLKQQIEKTILLRQSRTELETKTIASERISLQQRLQDAQKITPRLQAAGLNSLEQERRSLQQSLEDAEELTPVLQQRVLKQKELQELGAISQERVLQAEKEYRQSRQQIAETQSQLQKLQLQEAELQQKYRENLNKITQLNSELESLNTREKQLEQDNLEANNSEQNQLQDLEQAIARLQKEVVDSSMIKSPHAGCMIEITVTVGQYLNPGTSLGTLQTDGGAGEMMSFTYFTVEDGKKIRPQMPILITPDTVKRARFGGIMGEITQVSALPITSEGVTSVIGNSEIVQQLMGEAGGKIEAIANLHPNPQTFSGYDWSSSNGPQLEISPGTTTTVRVTVERRSPISFVLPILREWSGIKY